jgi:hypothetical protein
MNNLSIIINESGQITPLNNDKEVYSNSAACPLYGSESQGYNFLITGGYYTELEQYEDGKILTF